MQAETSATVERDNFKAMYRNKVKVRKVLVKLFSVLAGIAIVLWVTEPAGVTGNDDKPANTAVFESVKARMWADSVLKTMTLSDKVGQLFMVAAYSNKDQAHTDSLVAAVTRDRIGGVIFFQGGPVRQAHLTNLLQDSARVPLFVAIDGEWGLAMRLDSTIRYPRQMTLGAIENKQLIYDMGAEIARQCTRLGIHINFAPVADINSNPLNPVISSRSFGEQREEVLQRAAMYMNGMQDNKVLAVGKHFPGHGDTDTDSHKQLPVINKSRAMLDSTELYPFKSLIGQGLGGMMVAHLFIPVFDNSTNTASTLSPAVVNDLLKNELGFRGLVFTDALNMKGVSSFFKPGEVDLKAYLAGNDILLFPEDVPRAKAELLGALANKQIEVKDLDMRVMKILEAKYWAGLNNYKPIKLDGLVNDLNNAQAQWINYKLHEAALTLLVNKEDILPIKNLGKKNIACLSIGESLNNPFQQTLKLYAPVDCYNMEKNAVKSVSTALQNLLSGYSTVIISIHNSSTNASRRYGITDQMNEMINALAGKVEVIVVDLGNAYTLSALTAAHNANAVLLAYEDTELPQMLAAQMLFGGIGSSGKLPVSVGNEFKAGAGLAINGGFRVKYTMPQELGLGAAALARVDSLVLNAIGKGAMPGCQVVAIKNGKVFYNKAFGSLTYEKTNPVTIFDVYDLASITKIASTGLTAMRMYEQDLFELDKRVSRYLPELRHGTKREIEMRDIMTHQAGLQSWIPFWTNTMKDGKPNPAIYATNLSAEFPLRVADNLFIHRNYADTIWKVIMDSPQNPPGKMVYSDLSMIILARMLEHISNTSIDQYARINFYEPLGLPRLTFKPRERMRMDRVAPTENDAKFRSQLLQGDVHDPAAAMMGGVAGNAGLFSNATDLAVLMQMLLQGGTYGGEQFFKPQTIEEFTRVQFADSGNRRGLIFDKPEIDKSKNGPTAASASPRTFGHTGFTGTCAWADPQSGFVYVFLSNRVHPDADNSKLVKMNVRTDIQQAFYDAMLTQP